MRPCEVKELNVDDYLNLVRIGTDEDQAFWNEVSGVDFVKLAGNHVCWFNLFTNKHEILRVIKFIQSNLD